MCEQGLSHGRGKTPECFQLGEQEVINFAIITNQNPNFRLP